MQYKEYRCYLASYSLWPYELELAKAELEQIGKACRFQGPQVTVTADESAEFRKKLRRLAFFRSFEVIDNEKGMEEPTDQFLLEHSASQARSGNGQQQVLLEGLVPSGGLIRRKESNYATHGLHPYKGKFYPQLVRALVNLGDIEPPATILDPFMGSGTAVLESKLMGFDAIGVDLNPLAYLIANAKLTALDLDSHLIERLAAELWSKLSESAERWGLRHYPLKDGDAEPEGDPRFDATTLVERSCRLNQLDELAKWFPPAVLHKYAFLLSNIDNLSDDVFRQFCLVCLSSTVRACSQQDPRDLRVRRRKESITDAPVLSLFTSKLRFETAKLKSFCDLRDQRQWILGRHDCFVGDARNLARLGDHRLVDPEQVDMVITSPPYATALPYIDTDRLSLLLLGLGNTRKIRQLDRSLVGSREFTLTEYKRLIDQLIYDKARGDLPPNLLEFLRDLHYKNQPSCVGFRRRNLPALLYRYFMDMREALKEIYRVLRPNGQCYLVIGDNHTTLGTGEKVRIQTGRYLGEIAQALGFEMQEAIPITVTVEDRVHVKNAIRENLVLRFRRPPVSL